MTANDISERVVLLSCFIKMMSGEECTSSSATACFPL